MRFYQLYRTMLVTLFIDTLFYGIFYPDDSTCSDFNNQIDCEDLPSKVDSAASQCSWNANKMSCSLNPPPSNLVFYMIISMIIIIISLPLDMFLDFLMTTYCAKRPILEEIGLDSESWLGSSGEAEAHLCDSATQHSKQYFV
jgi:hypothetical protein